METMVDPEEAGDRDRLRQFLDAMSAKARGESAVRPSAQDFAPTEPFRVPDDIDVPTAPDELTDEEQHATDDGHDHGDQAAAASGARSNYAWGGHQNGRIPTKALKAIGQGSHKLETTAAEAWMAMRVAARREGIEIALTDSYRSYDAQVSVRKRKGHLVATATPGTSVHGWGRAVDANVNDPKVLRWLQANGAQYGWVNPAWAKRKGKSFEPWHYEFVGGQG